LLCGLAAAQLCLDGSRCAAASDQIETFDGLQTSWQIDDAGPATVRSHRRDVKVHTGPSGASEAFEFVAPRAGGSIVLFHPLRPSRVISELTLTLSVRSNHPGATVWLRVLFPNQKDPATGEVLSTFIRGETYTRAGKWQPLRCTTTDKLVQDQIILERARLQPEKLNHHDLYVDRVYLSLPLSTGGTELFLDDMRFRPIVDPRPDARIEQAALTGEKPAPVVDLRLGRLEVERRPFLPRIAPYHGESVDSLKQAGLNVVLVPNVEDVQLLAALKERGLWAMAEPPCAVSETGMILDARTAGMLPFSEETAPVLMWYVGTLIPGDKRDALVAWSEQIRHADRLYRRPVAADVAELERDFSRQVDLMSMSRHVVNTTTSFKDYREWLVQKRKMAIPGTYMWTWIQTEPVAANSRWRQETNRSPIVVEPEQIRLQVYAALSAGCRAIGFWKRTSLDSNEPGAEERRLVILQLNLELELLEPWLAAGTVSELVPFQIAPPANQPISRSKLDAVRKTPSGKRELGVLLSARQAQIERSERVESELEAAIIESHLGILVIPVWYEHHSQFVPGQMAAYDASIIVPGVDESARAWEVSPTGIRTLERERVPGGIRIKLKKLDETAAIILSSDPNLREKLAGKIQELAPTYARTAVALAKAKLSRVRLVDEELRSLEMDLKVAPHLMTGAQDQVAAAEKSLERADYDSARQQSADAMQFLRILQRAHWDFANLKLSSPVSSPYTVCFQTLPDHWRMVSKLGRSKADPSGNLLTSGDFEDEEAVVAEWYHSQNRVEGVRAAAELSPVSRKGSYALRLVAVPDTGVDTPTVVQQGPVSVSTPPVPVKDGQLVHIAGWVRVNTPVTGSLDGVMLYDNLTGTVGALRWRDKCDWQQFELVREIRESGDLTLTMTLQGLGEVQFDDLRIVPLNPRSGTRSGSGGRDADPNGGRPDLLRFFSPWQGRRTRTAEE